MGAKRWKGRDGGEQARVSGQSAGDAELHTVFVRGLPFFLSDSQLEDLFSEIGPVRHCFTIKEKGSDQHRGFGFVHFAVTEDAQRAVQEKNGSLVQGRTIKVEIAKRRAPLDQRRPKPETPTDEAPTTGQQRTSDRVGRLAESKKRESAVVDSVSSERVLKKLKPAAQVEGAAIKPKADYKERTQPKELTQSKQSNITKPDSGREVEKPKEEKERKVIDAEDDDKGASAMQRSARTVVVGGIVCSEMFEAIVALAEQVGPIESLQRTLSENELSSRSLAKDGCKPRAASLVFFSVKAAARAVAALHNQTVRDGVTWARQLGGEGSKVKKWRLIVRNLPFQVTESQLRELFTPAGFCWEISIPRRPDGMSKGFAFVGFTKKADAEKAIKLVNGKTVGKRPVAVDWSVGKKEYAAAQSTEDPRPVMSDESDRTASDLSEDEAESNLEESDLSDSEALNASSQAKFKSEQAVPRLEKKFTTKKRALEMPVEGVEANNYSVGTAKDKIKHEAGADVDQNILTGVDNGQEKDMMKRILMKVVSAEQGSAEPVDVVDTDEESEPNEGNDDENDEDESVEQDGKNVIPADTRKVKGKPSETNVAATASAREAVQGDINRTVFVRNLPPDVKVPELRKLFSDFGVVKSCRLVFHPVTQRPRGTAFLEYATKEAADSVVAAADRSGNGAVGLTLKGRQISVTLAVDRETAQSIAKGDSYGKGQEDRRNLALAKEGNIEEGMPAAEGVSKRDLEKRKLLEREKATKLQSPNFHVSRTRLSVHNVSKGMTEKALKKLFIEAVKSRASKQHPVIKQVKILKDETTGRARGTAFVEFAEHQHALVALRVLNNNPATFTAESRPIVEFAVENSLKLQKRAANLEKQRKFQSEKQVAKDVSVGKNASGEKFRGKPSRSVKQSPENRSSRGKVVSEDSPSESKGRKRKRDVRGDKSEPSEDGLRKRNVKGTKETAFSEAVARKPQESNQMFLKKAGRSKGAIDREREPNMQQVDGDVSSTGRRKGKLSRTDKAEQRLDHLVKEYRRKYFSSGPTNRTSAEDTKRKALTSGDLRRWFD